MLFRSLQVGAVLGPADLRGMQQTLERRLEDRGYRDPAVGLALQPVDALGGHALAVRIQEGPVTRLRRVIVTGRPVLPLWQVGEQVALQTGDVLDLLFVVLFRHRLLRAWPPRLRVPGGRRGHLVVLVPRLRRTSGTAIAARQFLSLHRRRCSSGAR